MKIKFKSAIISIILSILSLSVLDYSKAKDENKGPYAAFLAVHLEVGKGSERPPEYQKKYWPYLVKLVEIADKYNHKLTIMFQTQWAEYILQDKNKFNLIKKWQGNSHEIALHYHTVFHGGWNGFTNRTDPQYANDWQYRGTVKEMIKPVKELAAPYELVTACVGIDKAEKGPEPPGFIDQIDFPEEIIYDVDGISPFKDALGVPYKFEFKGKTRWQLKHALLSKKGPWKQGIDVLEVFKQQFYEAYPDEILGVVTHEINFAESSDYIEDWLKFLADNGVKIQTVQDIMKGYLKQ